MDIDALRTVFAEQSLTFLAGVPYVYHCHHYNLFHDQTIDDALGEEEGTRVRTRASRNAARQLLQAVCEQLSTTVPLERIQIATELLAWMGQGRLALDLNQSGGSASAAHLHYGHSWREKYGGKVRRAHPADAVAAGWSAAAAEVAFGLPAGSFEARETSCVAMREPSCNFRLEQGTARSAPPTVDEPVIRASVATPTPGVDEERIAQIGAGLVEFMKGVCGDERGLVQAFSVFVAAHMTNYYNETVYEAMHHVERAHPPSTAVVEELMREAGKVCVFNTFGNILLSPEWEGLVGPLSGDPHDTVSFSCAIARGLGFGHWAIAEFEPAKRLVLRCASNYEAPFYLHRYGRSTKPRSYFIQGSALAMMVLADRVKWRDKPKLTNDVYISLFRGKSPWKVEQTQCQTRGDAINEYVVTTT